jgi:hypothetical protein
MTGIENNERVESPRAGASLRLALSSRRALAIGVVAGSLLAACSSSDGAGAGGASGTSATAGAGPTSGGSGSDVGGAGSAGVATGGAGLGGDPGVAGSSASGAPAGGADGSVAGSSGAPAAGGASAGAGGASGGSTGGGPAGCPTGATFCDSFDAAVSLGTAWSTDNTLGATVKVVNTFTTTPGPTMAHSGTNAVQISFTTGSGYGMIVSKMGFPAPPAAAGYWARAWLYVETPASDAGHDVYIEGSTGTNLANNGARPLNTQAGKMSINIDPVGNGEASANTTTAIPRGAWTCFEWHISATGGNGDISLYVAGAMTAVATLTAKPIQALTEQRIGYERYAGGAAGNLWIDDYAIGTARLGCL